METNSPPLTVIQKKLVVRMPVILVKIIKFILFFTKYRKIIEFLKKNTEIIKFFFSAFAPISQIRFWGAQTELKIVK